MKRAGKKRKGNPKNKYNGILYRQHCPKCKIRRIFKENPNGHLTCSACGYCNPKKW